MSGTGYGASALLDAHALFCAGDLAEAAVRLGVIATEDPAFPHAAHLLGLVNAMQGRVGQAIALFETACTHLPDNHELLANLARAYAAVHRHADALVLLQKIISAGAATTATYSDCAAMLERLDQDALALASYEAALALDHDACAAWSGKGNLLHKKRRYEEALACHNKAVAIGPVDAQAWSNRASTLDKLGRMTDGLVDHDRALALSPRSAAVWSGRGVSLVMLDRIDEGLHCFDQALEIEPTHFQARINRAAALAETGRHHESLSEFDLALQSGRGAARETARAHASRAMVQLALGDSSGWSGYEYRLHDDQECAQHDAQANRWTGVEPIQGKRLLLWSEQGHGDSIQFCRYAITLAELGAVVLLEVPAPLTSLCSQLPACSVHATGDVLPAHDFQLPMMSMPLALQRQSTAELPPCRTAYLHAPLTLVDKWREQMPPRVHARRIGIVCSGSVNHPRNTRRSVPLAVMLALGSMADLVLLQPELTAEDKRSLEASPNTFWPVINKGDFADVAGLIANTDLVVSVDTSIAHLAGALAKPTWLVLPQHAEWRWMTNRTDTPWYASVRLFRQPGMNDWQSVLDDVIQALRSEDCQAMRSV